MNPLQALSRRARRTRRPSSVSLRIEALEERAVPASLIAGPTSNSSNEVNYQGEVGVAVNPLDINNSVTVANDAIGGFTRVPAYYTLDGGASWDVTYLNNSVDGLGTNSRYDPNVAFDSDGNVYVVYSAGASSGNRSRLIVAKSSDGGVTYHQTGEAASHPSFSIFHTAMITTRANPDGDDSVLAGWSQSLGGTTMQASLSTDGGATFSVVNTRINDLAPERTFMSWAVADADGNFHFTWEVNLPGTSPDGVFYHDVLDGTTLESLGPDTTITNLMLTDFAQPHSRIPAQPDRGIFSVGTIDADRTFGAYHGRLYFSYADRETTTTDDTNIFVRYSDDNGASWSDPILVNDDGGVNSQFFARLAVDPVTGWVFMTWYDTRDDEANQLVHVYGSASLDGGDTWLPNIQLTEEASNESRTNPLRNGNNYGEYTGLVAYGGVAFGAWTDARPSHFARNREEVYFGWFYVDEGEVPGPDSGGSSSPFDVLAYFAADSAGEVMLPLPGVVPERTEAVFASLAEQTTLASGLEKTESDVVPADATRQAAIADKSWDALDLTWIG